MMLSLRLQLSLAWDPSAQSSWQRLSWLSCCWRYAVFCVFVTVAFVVRVVERGASPGCAAPAVIVIVVVVVVVFVVVAIPGCDAAAKAIIAFASDVAGSAGIEPDSDMV